MGNPYKIGSTQAPQTSITKRKKKYQKPYPI